MKLSRQKVPCLARILFVSIFNCKVQAVPYLLVYDSVFEKSLRNDNDNYRNAGNSRSHKYELIERKNFTSLTQLDRNRTVFSLSTSFEFLENSFLEHYGFGTSLEELVRAFSAFKFLENTFMRVHLYSLILETCCRSSRPKVFVEKTDPESSTKFTGNSTRWSWFFLQALYAGPATLLEFLNSNPNVFQ